MSPSSLRALLLALAMVVQTVAGGFSVARAAPAPVDSGVSAHCAQAAAESGAADHARHDARHHMCESCCLCAGSPSLSVADDSSLIFERRVFQVLGFTTPDNFRSPARLAAGHPARGPPATRALRA